MKRLIIVIIAVSALMSACGNGSDETMIERTAFGYLDAMGNYKIEHAEKYADSTTRMVTLQFIERTIMPNLDESYIKSNTPARIEIKEIQIIDDTSAVVSYHKSTPITEQDGVLQMRKEDGVWKAHVVIVVPKLLDMAYATRDSLDRYYNNLQRDSVEIRKYEGPRPR